MVEVQTSKFDAHVPLFPQTVLICSLTSSKSVVNINISQRSRSHGFVCFLSAWSAAIHAQYFALYKAWRSTLFFSFHCQHSQLSSQLDEILLIHVSWQPL